MRPEPVLTADAHADVLQAVEYYNEQRPSLGFDFLDEFERATSLLREAPLLSTLVDPPIRRRLLRRFPYGIFFVAGSTEEPDVIVAVLDLRQEPEVIRQAYRR
jgi:toxin ParE1/3/4